MTQNITMTAEKIEQMIKEFISQELAYDQPNLVLTNNLKIIEQRIVDSMDLFRLVRFVEEEIGIFWEPEELVLKNFETIDNIKGYILGKLMP
ncbi:acyl carrier protein [Cuspidothrix issatschenkoi]|jgi:acyl carrier protein|nr:acyl carrier protein [Cuspidothrix issatschenkoi]AIU56832.1 anatoxin-a synthetase D acyl carrier protein [Cuspidothrix issatschenkoi LBRI48]AIU56841.1 anatoxin-a synthetase D acyl carrier protein [Cuspidothrix issatschenkoi RM-6]AIU56850.1 anatoxin-a synthetase D acyl carrier protein [Cuspidothrix issatschenkoi CHABD3]